MTSESTNGRKRVGGADVSSPPRPPKPIHRAGALDPDEAGEPGLTDEQVQDLKTRLEEMRANLIASIDERRGQERNNDREVGDEMDDASTEGVTAMTSKLLERDAQLFREVELALAKMRDGTYGLCEGTGEPIGYARLNLRPWARYSVEYQEEIERSARTRGLL